MKNRLILMLGVLVAILAVGCNKTAATSSNPKDDIATVLEVAKQQIGYQIKLIEDAGTFINPRTVVDGVVQYVPADDWTSGFFPGTLFYMYDLTQNKKWLDYGVKYTETLDSIKHLKWHHDVGFMIYCSYGNGLKYTDNKDYQAVIIEAAKSLGTRFRPTPGVFQSWDEDRGWQGKRGWMCPVIIDNMMNLEMMFRATQLSGDSTYHNMAVAHADNTLENHFRDDWSCYHVIDYDKVNGGVRHKQTAQGYADESAWARGQAWALYGYAMCYRFTHDEKYLNATDSIYKFIFNHKNMPEDLVPYWDFDAPNIPNEPRDASAAAVIASALYELAEYGKTEYKATADKIVTSLSSPVYRALVGTNGNFLLMHSVGSIPHGHEIDVPINYTDYYFLEALIRKRNIEKK